MKPTKQEPRPYDPGERVVSIRRLEGLLGRGREDIERIAAQAGGFYRPFDRRKERGKGKWRHIDNPEGELKDLQKNFARRVLRHYPFPSAMCGGVFGRSIVDNIRPHVGSAAVVGIDIRDCFPRTHDKAVFAALCRCLGCSEQIAGILTKILTFQHRVPQGSPASPGVVNLCLLGLYDDIKAIAERLYLSFSVYVDDITLSGPKAREAIEPVIHCVREYGYSVRQRKVEVMSSNDSQSVTGGVVNQKVSAGRKRIDDIRGEIFEVANQEDVWDWQLRRIRGRIQSVKQLSESQAASLERLARRLLPDQGKDGKKPRSDETRPCKSFRRHKYERL